MSIARSPLACVPICQSASCALRPLLYSSCSVITWIPKSLGRPTYGWESQAVRSEIEPWVFRRGGIQVFASERPTIACFCIVILETKYPVTSGAFGRALGNSVPDFSNGAQIAIYLSQVH